MQAFLSYRGSAIFGYPGQFCSCIAAAGKGRIPGRVGKLVQGGTMSIRTIWSFLAAAALLCPGIARSTQGQTESEPAPATAPKKITARQVLEAAFAKTTAAKTV